MSGQRPGGRIATLLHNVVIAAAIAVVVDAGWRRWRVQVEEPVRPLSARETERIAADAVHPLFASRHADTVHLFADYECVFCAIVYPQMASRSAPYALVLHPVALTGRLSVGREATFAAACAAKTDKLHEFSYTLFSRRDSLGAVSWAGFAQVAGVPDTSEFERCFISRAGAYRVRSDSQLAADLGVVATPAAVWRGKHYTGSAGLQALLTSFSSAR